MIKNYSIKGVSNNIEIGKRGCFLNYNKQSNKIDFTNSSSELCKINASDGVNTDDVVNVGQISNSTISGDLSGSFNFDANGNITLTLNVENNDVSKFEHVTTNQTLSVNKNYYGENTITLTLPDTTNVNVGDYITVRNKFDSDVTIAVDGTNNESIITDVNTSANNILMDVPDSYTILFNGTDWEAL